MAKMKFTEAKVRDLKHTQKTTWYSHDGEAFPGLHLAVGQQTKTWYLKKRNPTTNKTQTINLGRYPAMSLEMAAERAKTTGAEIHNGTRGSEKMDTLRDAFEYHIRTKRKAGKMGDETERGYRSTMGANMADFMDMRLENITHIALQDHLLTFNPSTANLLRSIIRASYRTAKKQRRSLDNPAEGIELKSVVRRETEVQIDDLPKVWSEIAAMPETRQMAWIVALFTGIRHKSVVTLRWSPDPMGVVGHVDLDNRVIHLPRMKNQLARDIPICEFVTDAFKRQRGKDAVFVFPSDVKEGVPLYSMGRLSEGVGIAHDMRGHFVTAGARCELPAYIIAYLKGDKISADNHQMVAHYLGAVGSHAHVERISEVLRELCGIEPAFTLERIREVT